MNALDDIHADINILYVEDEEKISNIVNRMLNKVFNDVKIASNGEEALAIFKKYNDFDIVVSDINMPVMNGIELIRNIKKIDSDIPIVLTTAHSESNYLFDAIRYGVNSYLVKPIDMTKLISTISKAVESRILKKQIENVNLLLYDDLEQVNFQLNSIVNTQDNFIAIINKDNISLLNSSFMKFLNINSIKELGKNIGSFSELIIEKDAYKFINTFDIMNDISLAIKKYDNNFLVCMKDKHNKEESFKLDLKTYEYNGLNYVLTFTSISKLNNTNKLDYYNFNHDPITNLYTKEYFSNRLNDEMNRYLRYNNYFCVSMIEIDFIEELRNTLSYNDFNKILFNLSKIIFKSLRETDIMARWDNEKIIILHLETTSKQLYNKLEELMDEVNKSSSMVFANKQVAISCGMSQFSLDDTIETLIKRVDKTLNLAHKINNTKLAVG